MRLLVLALLSSAIINDIIGQDTVILPTQVPSHVFDGPISPDFLVQLLVDISEDKIPHYLIGVIYKRAREKNVSSEAVMKLVKAENASFESVQLVLDYLGINHDRVFSINGFYHTLQVLGWSFTNFYNTLISKLNIQGTSLRNALVALGIDVNEFSAGIAWGDPDPWEEFIQGDFSKENLEYAASEAGINLEILWEGIRDLFIDDLITLEIEELVEILLDHNIDKEEALTIWEAIPITNEHVLSIEIFKEILNKFSERVGSQVAVGILTSKHEAIVHRSVYETFKEEEDLLDIQVRTLVTSTLLEVNDIHADVFSQMVLLKHSYDEGLDNLTIIKIDYKDDNLTDCIYVTFQNNNLLTLSVPKAIYKDETYELPRNLISNVVPGSALVCDDVAYGLARGAEGDVIIIDAFVDYNSADGLILGSWKIVVNGASSVAVLATLRAFML